MPDAPTVDADLRAAIDRSGYYPELVADALRTALAGESVSSFVVHHEATFDRDELRRHVSVLALTATRLVVAHTDEHPADDSCPSPYATTTTEVVPVSRVGSIVVNRVVAEPARHAVGSVPREVVLTVGWGAVSRLELEPATCGDPECEADHGYSGSATSDDFTIRVSAAADGEPVVRQVLDFARELSAATASFAMR